MYFRPRAALVAALLAAATAAACDDDDDATDTITGAGALLSPVASDANIVALAHESNLGEIQAGALAAQRATNAGVRAFAAMMVTDHTTLDTAGASLAARNGIAPALPDGALPRLQAQELAALQGAAAGTAFDRLYVAQQVAAPRRAARRRGSAAPRPQARVVRAVTCAADAEATGVADTNDGAGRVAPRMRAAASGSATKTASAPSGSRGVDGDQATLGAARIRRGGMR
jgi:predicted outer membrane protein